MMIGGRVHESNPSSEKNVTFSGLERQGKNVRCHHDHPPILQTYTKAPLRAFHDEGPSLPAMRGNLTMVDGVDKQKTVSYRGIVHILRPWRNMYF